MVDLSQNNNANDVTFEGNTILWNHFSCDSNLGVQSKSINLDVSAADGDKMIHLSITNFTASERSEDYNGYLWLNIDEQEIEFMIV